MKFLKSEVLYSTDFSEDNESLAKAYKEYDENLLKIKPYLPNKLLKCYMETDRFHDYCIKKIVYYGDANCYKEKSDKIEIDVEFENIEIKLFFDEIIYFNLKNELDIKANYHSEGIEEIVICEIDRTDNDYFSLEFETSSRGSIKIVFKKFNVIKKIKRQRSMNFN